MRFLALILVLMLFGPALAAASDFEPEPPPASALGSEPEAPPTPGAQNIMIQPSLSGPPPLAPAVRARAMAEAAKPRVSAVWVRPAAIGGNTALYANFTGG